MEDYEYKVINLHATYSKIISKSTSNTSKNTSKSSLFTQGTAALFGGCFEVFFASGLRGSELLMLLGTRFQLPSVLQGNHSSPRRITDFYRILPTFYRSFGLSRETPAIKNCHSQDSGDSGSRRIEFSRRIL